MAFIAVLFLVGPALGSGGYEHGKTMGSETMQMEKAMQPSTAGWNLDNSQVRELQRILNDKGFDAGPADGVLGTQTQQALRDFQKSEGLTATGIPDRETLQALATDPGTQEVFGLSPEFGEKGMEQKQPMEEKMNPEGGKTMDRY
jgi:peptidoglycan hydrolase-like protein with peptidoglycan-binding domain